MSKYKYSSAIKYIMVHFMLIAICAISGSNGSNLLYAQDTGDCSGTMPPITQRASSELRWSPNSSFLAIATRALTGIDGGCDTDDQLQILNGVTGDVVFTYHNDDIAIAGLAWNSASNRLVATDLNGIVRVWDATNWQLLGSYSISSFGLLEATWNPNNNHVAVAGYEGIIYVLDPNNGQVIQIANIGKNDNIDPNIPIGWMQWSPDGTKLGVGRIDGTIEILDASTLSVIRILQVNSNLSARGSWSPDNTRIATTSDGSDAQLWDIQSGHKILSFQGHTKVVNAIAWNQSGSMIATTSADATIRIWNATTGQQLNVITAPAGVGQTLQIDWSAAGKLAYGSIVASQNGTDPGPIPPPITTPPPTPTPMPSNTPTIGPTPTRTPTVTNTLTNTSTNTATPTESSGTFPSTGVLDNFDRTNGTIGSNWSGATGGYSIASNKLNVGTGDAIYWNAASFGVNQEAYVTLDTINTSASEIDLLLKLQGTIWSSGVLEALYDPIAHVVQISTYTSSQNWVQRGADISVTFAAGDVFGAKAKADGTVEVYKNGTLIGSRDITAWPYYANGGKIGLWMISASGTVLDNFGGGDAGGTSPSATPGPSATNTPTYTSTPTPGPTATPTRTPTPTVTNTPTLGPSATPTRTPTLTNTPTPTATTASGTFPTAGVLDNFNRSNGAIGSNWSGTKSGYAIASNKLNIDSEGDIYWSPTSFNADQEVYVKLDSIDTQADEIDLLLKVQGSTWSSGVIEVFYDPVDHVVQVWTYTSSQNWVQRGADISVTFAAGDQFGARAKSNGMVEVYKNGSLLGSRDVSAWSYNANGGKIGLWMIGVDTMNLDDFGGGNS